MIKNETELRSLVGPAYCAGGWDELDRMINDHAYDVVKLIDWASAYEACYGRHTDNNWGVYADLWDGSWSVEHDTTPHGESVKVCSLGEGCEFDNCRMDEDDEESPVEIFRMNMMACHDYESDLEAIDAIASNLREMARQEVEKIDEEEDEDDD